jgi:hypothetical protein
MDADCRNTVCKSNTTFILNLLSSKSSVPTVSTKEEPVALSLSLLNKVAYGQVQFHIFLLLYGGHLGFQCFNRMIDIENGSVFQVYFRSATIPGVSNGMGDSSL